MAKKQDTFLLVSLDDDKAKRLANVINSDVCRKILDFLANKDSTETEISKQLNVPISTVHYNLKMLVESGLVKSDEFHYSQKGKEVNHYSIANKYIIIAPKSTESIAIKLKRIIPVFAVVAATGFLLQYISGAWQKSAGLVAEQQVMSKAMDPQVVSKAMTADNVYKEGASAALGMGVDAVNATAESATQMAASPQAVAPQAFAVSAQEPNIALWFAAGALFALVAYLAYDILKERFK